MSGKVPDLRNSPRPLVSGEVVEGAERCLRSNAYLALKNVRCEYREGVLTLRGCLPTYYLKQMAQTAVGQVEGVQQIVNEIEVVTLHGGPGRRPPIGP
jgi:osmotically-inducible protein OsmY